MKCLIFLLNIILAFSFFFCFFFFLFLKWEYEMKWIIKYRFYNNKCVFCICFIFLFYFFRSFLLYSNRYHRKRRLAWVTVVIINSNKFLNKFVWLFLPFFFMKWATKNKNFICVITNKYLISLLFFFFL